MRGPLERSWLAQAAVGLVCAKVMVATLVFDPRGLYFSQPKALIGEALSLALVGVLVALAVRYGRAVLPWSPVHAAVAALVVAFCAATLFAVVPRIGVFGANGRSLGLLASLDLVVLYAAVAMVGRFEWARRWIALTLAGVVVLVAAYELLGTFGLVPLSDAGRPVSTLGNADPLGQLLGPACGAALALAAAAGDRDVRRGALAVAAVALGALLLSGTRAPLAGLVVAGGIAAVVWIARDAPGADRRRRIAAFVGASLVVAALVAVSPLGARLGGSLTAADRLDLYRVALEETRSRPVLGVGPDNYVTEFGRYRAPGTRALYDSYVPQTSPHSWVLKAATDAGLLGLAALLATFALALVMAWRRRADPWVVAATAMLIAYLVGGAISIDNVATTWIPWIAVGLLAVPAAARSEPAPAPPSRQPVSRRERRAARRSSARGQMGATEVAAWSAVTVGSAAAALALFAAMGTLGAARDLQVAWSALRTGDPANAATAVAAARRATAVDPYRSDYWDIQSLSSRLAGDTNGRLEAARHAAELAPYDGGILAELAVAAAIVGQGGNDEASRASLESARAAIAADPYRPDVHAALALASYANGDYAGAAAAAEDAKKVDDNGLPSFVYATAAHSYLQTDDFAGAERWARAGLPLLRVGSDDEVAQRLVLARALAGLGRNDDALAQMRHTLDEKPDNKDTLKVYEDLFQANKRDYAAFETFARPPAFTVESGERGQVRSNVLVAPDAPPEWRVATAPLAAANVRIAVQFQVSALSSQLSQTVYRTLRIGRGDDPATAVSVAQEVGDRAVTYLYAGSTVLAKDQLLAIKPNDWYWLVLEIRGTAATARLAHSGTRPVPLDLAQPAGSVTAQLQRAPTGSVFVASDLAPGPRIGGLADKPGGFYIEKLPD